MMNRERIASKYKNNAVAGKRKHIYARLLDYFSVFVASYLMFTIAYSVAARLPAVKQYSDTYMQKSNDIMEYVVSSHLQHYNEGKTKFLDLGEDAKVYIANIAKNSGYVNNINLRIKESDGSITSRAATIEESFVNELEQYKIDNISYYYKNFKINSETSNLNSYVFEGVDYKDDKDTYIYQKVMKVDESLFVSSDDPNLTSRGGGVSRFTVLTSEKTTSLINYVLAGDPDNEGKTIYNSIFDAYIRGAQFGISDIEKNSTNYQNKVGAFRLAYQDLSKAIAVVYFISYAIAFVIMLVVMRFVGKSWTTIGLHVMKLGMSSYEEFEPSVIQLVGYHLLNFVLFSTSSFISFYFIGIFGVLSLELFKGFTLLAVLLSLLVLNIASFVMIFFTKKPHDLSTFITRILIKDKNEFDVPVGMENISDEELKKINEKEVVSENKNE